MTQAHDRNDYERSLRLERAASLTTMSPMLEALETMLRDRLPADAAERAIRARERTTVRWLKEKPWLAGRGLAATVAAARRAHSASIRRSYP